MAGRPQAFGPLVSTAPNPSRTDGRTKTPADFMTTRRSRRQEEKSPEGDLVGHLQFLHQPGQCLPFRALDRSPDIAMPDAMVASRATAPNQEIDILVGEQTTGIQDVGREGTDAGVWSMVSKVDPVGGWCTRAGATPVPSGARRDVWSDTATILMRHPGMPVSRQGCPSGQPSR